MPTFIELQRQVAHAKNKKVVLQHLIEHLDDSFRSVAGQRPKLTLLNDDKLPIPEDTFESLIEEVLLDEISHLDADLVNILGTEVNVVDPLLKDEPEQASAPATVGPLPAPVQGQQPQQEAKKTLRKKGK